MKSFIIFYFLYTSINTLVAFEVSMPPSECIERPDNALCLNHMVNNITLMPGYLNQTLNSSSKGMGLCLGSALKAECPNYLIKSLKDNRGHFYQKPAIFLGVKTANEVCGIPESGARNTRDPISSYADLEKTILANPQFHFGYEIPPISSCLSDQSKKYGNEELKVATATHYLNLGRLQLAQQSSIEAIANIDSILGTDNSGIWDQQNGACQGLFKIRELCKKKSQCKAKGGLDKIVERVAINYPTYLALKEKLEELDHQSCGRNLTCVKAKIEKKKDYLNAIAVFEMLFPVFKGEQFKKILKNKKASELITSSDLTRALRAQYSQDRDNYRKQLDEFHNASNCVLNKNPEDTCDNFNAVLAKAPLMPAISVEDSQSKNDKLKSISLNNYLGTAQCATEANGLLKEGSDIIWNTSAQIALTIATAPLAIPEALLAKHLLSGAKFAIAASEQGLLVKNVASAIKTASTVKNAVKASVVSAAIANSALAMKEGYQKAVKSCSDTIDLASLPETKENGCASSPSESFPSSVYDAQECVISSALAAVNFLPLVSAGSLSFVRYNRWQEKVRNLPHYNSKFTIEQTQKLADDKNKLVAFLGKSTNQEKVLEADFPIDRSIVLTNNMAKKKGKLHYKVLTKDELETMSPGIYQFALMPGEKNLRLSRNPNMGHASITNYGPVLSAGEIVITKGADGKNRIVEIGLNSSGHYKPSAAQGVLALEAIWSEGINDLIKVYKHSDKVTSDTLLETKAVELVLTVGNK